MRAIRALPAALACVLATAAGADAATFTVFSAGSSDVLGSFEAPAVGGPLSAALLLVKGGVFDMLGTGSLAPVYDPTLPDVHGAGGSIGAVFNSVAFDTTDVSDNPITCGIGECAFSFFDKFDAAPPEWHLDYVVDGGAALAFGRYEIAAATVPLPASGAAMLGALFAVGLATRRRGRG